MTVKLNGSSSGSVALDAPASTTGGADVVFKLPVADGTAGQVLSCLLYTSDAADE